MEDNGSRGASELQSRADGAAPGDKPTTLVTRKQLAAMLEKDPRTIRRYEKGQLAPALTIGPDGVHRFEISRVQEILRLDFRERARPARAEAWDDGETTAAVFDLFEHDLEPIGVILRLKLPAFAVDALHREWVALRGGYVVDGETARAISMVRGTPILDARTLRENLESTAPPYACWQCHEIFQGNEKGGVPAYCAICASELQAKRAREEAEQAAAEKAKRNERREALRAEADFEAGLRRHERMAGLPPLPPLSRV